MAEAGVPDESCQNYVAAGNGTQRHCHAESHFPCHVHTMPCPRAHHAMYMYTTGHFSDTGGPCSGTQCTPMHICQNCAPGKGCWAVESPPLWYVEEYGVVLGEQRMMAEIAARGPITATIAVTDELEAYTGGTPARRSPRLRPCA
uniref:Uncharacterized protein n=1 Tax=Calcidiscus leptoporus TaxID=127549 RepID=A0A7S0J018_9EUKA